jgi:hypothetical protein
MWEMIQINVAEVFNILFTNTEYSSYPYTISIFFFNPNENFTVKAFSVLSFFCFNSYLLMSLVTGLFTFGGCWKIFRIFHSLYPQQSRLLAISTLFIPSVFFWSSVLSKEIICIGAMGYLFHCIYYFFIFKKKRILHFAGMLLFSYILIRVKLYILLAFIPSLMIFLLMTSVNKMKHPVLKKLTLPFALSLLGLFLYLLLAKLGNMLTQFSLDKIIESGMITYNYLTQEGFAESRYSLGDFDPSIGGVLKLAPAGINVTLFRPYLWEVTKPITLIASIESLLTLLLTLIVILRTGIVRSLRKIFSNPLILFCLTFSLVFSIAVGVTSGNFGTLMRYKIPMMPFYFTALVLIYAREKKVIGDISEIRNTDT